jgi:hypothetical protein
MGGTKRNKLSFHQMIPLDSYYTAMIFSMFDVKRVFDDVPSQTAI